MQNGALTAYLDVPQVMLYVFWAFFFALIFWLRKEDRREGYPLESDPSGRVGSVGLLMARPKLFRVRNGDIFAAPNLKRDTRPIAARRVGPWPGAPLVPTGNPLVDGVGPAAWAERADRPDQHPTMPLIQIRRGRHDLARSRDQFRFGETAPEAPTRMQRSDMAAITERDEISAALLNKR